MRFIYLAFLLFSVTHLSSQNTPVITKATATWCPTCGRSAWDFMEAMKMDLDAGPAVTLNVHFQGSDLENETSKWFAANLGASSRPLFYLNNEFISVGSNWQPILESADASIDEINNNLTAGVKYNSVLIEEGVINVTAEVIDIPAPMNKFFIGTYIFEDKVVANQAQRGNAAVHPNILRASMTTEHQGTEITDFGDYEFSLPVDAEWNEENLGVVTIIWEEVGDTYMMLASTAAHNISLLSDTDEILDASIFTFRDAGTSMIIEASDNANYGLTLSDISGRKLRETNFSQAVSIEKTNLISGMYILNLQSDKGQLTQQIFIK